MGCVAATAKRRRAQHRNGFRHLAKPQRPKYATVDAAVSARRLRKLIEGERLRQQRTKKS